MIPYVAVLLALGGVYATIRTWQQFHIRWIPITIVCVCVFVLAWAGMSFATSHWNEPYEGAIPALGSS